MKKLLLPILFLMLALTSMSQNLVSISGIITDTATGNPIPNHAVTISNDSSAGWFYYQTVYTNSNGFYVDTVPVPLNTQGILYVRTTDCQNYLHQVVITFMPTVLNFTVDFAICNFNAPCVANFTYVQYASHSFQFTDLSQTQGLPVTWGWDFGDGATSAAQNPQHVYGAGGWYNVTLSISDQAGCSATITKSVFASDSTGGGCQAAFVVYPDSNALYSYQFWNQSTGNNISTFTWSFGDGTSQTITFPGSPNVSHTYNQPGTYLACLTIQSNDSSCYDVTCDTLVIGSGGGCQAAFVAIPDSMGTLQQYQFIDQSSGTPAIVSWAWNFGDPSSGVNNTSSLQNPAHIFTVPGVYNVCLTIYGAGNCTDTYCATIIVGTGPGCQANYTYTTNPTIGTNTVEFTDLSTGNPVSWFWNFGDGTSSTLQNPVHSFSGAAVPYMVCLTISGDSCSSTYCQNVFIQDSVNYHQVYGHVYTGNLPVTIGTVMIFSMNTAATYPPFVEVSPLDSTGGYYFSMVPDGSYYIIATPFDSNGYLPTYYGDVINWEQATLITLGTANNPYNINLVPSDQMTPGPGSASGQINTGDAMTIMLDQINMILMNEQGNAIGFTRVSASGAFDFSTLAYGTYYLHPEMPGITSDNVMIIISVEKPHAEVVMTFTGNSILGMKDDLSLVNSWTVYPNPLNDLLSVNIDLKQSSEVIAAVYDLAGHLMIKKTLMLTSGNNKIEIGVTSLSPGIYALRIHSAAGVNLNTKLIKTK